MNNLQKPYIFKKTKYFDNRGYFQEIFLEKEFKKKIKFTAIAFSKKKCDKRLTFSIKKYANKNYYSNFRKNIRCSC